MEMENSAMLQVMSTQTSILEEIRELRRKDVMQGQQVSAISPTDATSQISMTTPEPMVLPEMDTSMVQPPEMVSPEVPMMPYNGTNYYDSMTPPMQPTSHTPPPLTNPLSYQTVSQIPVIGGVAGAATMGVEDAIAFDASTMSKEATAEYFAQRSRGIQMGAVEGAGNVLEGAGTLGGFMVGGLLGGLAVGTAVGVGTSYIAKEMTQGAEASLNYQDILRRDGYKAFNALESTTEYGGIGLSLDDQQELGSFMRDEAVNNFLDDDEMSNILQGSLDNKLLKSVDDVKSFKDKFSGIVKTVKEISLTLDQTIDEAIEFMGEMERRGVGVDKMAGIAAGSKVGASFLGMDATQYSQQMMQQTDSITAGTTMNAENVMESQNFNSYLVSGISENSAEGDGVLKQYIKNNGGELAVAGAAEASFRSFYEGAGQESLMAMFGGAFDQDEAGNFALNQERLEEMMSSGMSPREMMAASTEAVSQLDETSKVKLASSIGSIFNQDASSTQILGTAQFIQDQFQEMSGVDMDDETALVTMGLASDYDQARLMNEMLVSGNDDDAQSQFGVLSFKEEMDSAKRAANPGLKKRIKFWWEDTVANPLGDIGEAFSNPVGDISQDLQMWMSGIEEDGLVGGAMVEKLSSDTESELFSGEDSNTAKLQKSLAEMRPDLEGSEGIEEWDGKKIDINGDQFKALEEQLDNGELSAAAIKEMRQNLEDDKYTGSAEDRIEYIVNKASGEYEGFWGGAKQLVDYSSATTAWNLGDDGIRSGDFNSAEELESQQKELDKSVKASTKELTKILSNEDIGVNGEELAGLQELIEAGDIDAVKGITKNKDVLDIAKEFQGHAEERAKLEEATGIYSENFKNTQGVLTLTEGLYDFIDAADIHDQETFDDMYGKSRKELETKMKAQSRMLPGMDDQEMADTFNYVMDERLNVIETLKPEDRIALAERLTEIDDSIQVKDMYKEGTKEIDAEKLSEHIANVQRVQNTDESAVGNSLKTSSTEEVSQTASAHAESIDILTETFKSETARINATIEEIKTKNHGKYTGVTT